MKKIKGYEPVGVFDLMDDACASALGISVDEWITTIEKFSLMRMEVIIYTLLDENVSPEKIERIKRMFEEMLIK